ncbi:MAG: PTS sugar transporter subunit IIB [Candidatus Asgardarchaeia archaeon]
MKKLRVVTVCGMGMGTALLMKMLVENTLRELGVPASVEATNVAIASGYKDADIIVAIVDLKKNLERLGKPLCLLENVIDKEACKKKLIEVLKQIGYEGFT